MNEQEFAELAAGAALNALSPDDARRFDDALVAHPEWRAIAEADAETADLLSGSVAPVSPPPGIRAALLAQIAATPQNGEPTTGTGPTSPDVLADERPRVDEPSPSDPDEARASAPKRRWTRTVFALAACLAVLVGVGIGAVALNGQLNRPASVVALEQIQSASDAEQASVELPPEERRPRIGRRPPEQPCSSPTVCPPLPTARPMSSGTSAATTRSPCGVFDVEDGRATAALEGDMHAGDVIAVTVEQAGGSPSGTPTSDPVIVIPTA